MFNMQLVQRIIMHLDMDAFFAAVEEKRRPRLRGLPVVVGADPKGGKGRGVVATANYKAREYGIRSAMPISKAWQLAKEAEFYGKPKVVFVEADFREYSSISRRIMTYLSTIGRAFEQTSIDEAYLDVSHLSNYHVATKVAQEIKDYILRQEKLTCSIGIAPNKMLAKIASDICKPNGLKVVFPEEAQNFLDPLPVRKIPGIGPKTEAVLKDIGVRSVLDLRNLSKAKLCELFGKWGEEMWESARGIDDDKLTSEREVKSVGLQQTLEKDTLNAPELISLLVKLSKEVYQDAIKSGGAFRTLSIMVRFEDFKTKTRSYTSYREFSDKDEFASEALKLFLPFLDGRENEKRKKIRLLGVRALNFIRQIPLL
jgi:DNA polymerase IV (DinB-like DNA polymerase)